jgi:hypothetical protein
VSPWDLLWPPPPPAGGLYYPGATAQELSFLHNPDHPTVLPRPGCDKCAAKAVEEGCTEDLVGGWVGAWASGGHEDIHVPCHILLACPLTSVLNHTWSPDQDCKLCGVCLSPSERDLTQRIQYEAHHGKGFNRVYPPPAKLRVGGRVGLSGVWHRSYLCLHILMHPLTVMLPSTCCVC